MRQCDVNPLARFLQKVDAQGFDPDACWEWRGPVNSNGYGRFVEGDRHILAHRRAYEFFVGSILEGKVVCHTCDNRLCVNPHHLWMGTQSENLKDAVRKGRMFRPNTNGERNGSRRLDLNDVRVIREMSAGGLPRFRIAKVFGVSASTVGDIISHKTWKDAA